MMVGKTIRLLRVSSDLSQGKLARALGVTAGYLSLVEKGKREPSLGFLRGVAHYFKVPVGFLLLGDCDGNGFHPKQRRLLTEIQRSLLEYVISRREVMSRSRQKSAVAREG